MAHLKIIQIKCLSEILQGLKVNFHTRSALHFHPPTAHRQIIPLQVDIHFEVSALDGRRVLCYFVLTFLPEDG